MPRDMMLLLFVLVAFPIVFRSHSKDRDFNLISTHFLQRQGVACNAESPSLSGCVCDGGWPWEPSLLTSSCQFEGHHRRLRTKVLGALVVKAGALKWVKRGGTIEDRVRQACRLQSRTCLSSLKPKIVWMSL
ncbi:hypothetical protein V6N12_069234 [Hibiscus sabdariffa]|uniref:Secreted protein n=1 Tax=Hibiscus sabdariffa TaxID=183260 RepID=A0ABR2FDA9_9ROSI